MSGSAALVLIRTSVSWLIRVLHAGRKDAHGVRPRRYRSARFFFLKNCEMGQDLVFGNLLGKVVLADSVQVGTNISDDYVKCKHMKMDISVN
jgi:hypothetical protein